MATTYSTVWLARRVDGRLYPDWRQIGTATGRITASAPPVQQIPRGPHRQAIAAGAVCRLRVGGGPVSDRRPPGARPGREGRSHPSSREDGHARALLRHEQRGSAPRDRAQLGRVVEEEEAEGYREAFFVLYPRVRVWQQRLREERPREIWSAGGRRLIVEESAPDSVRFNTPVQAAAADGLKAVLGLLWERRAECPGAVPILAAHDELVIEADQDQAEPATGWLRAAMIDGMKPLLDPIPVTVEISVGESWRLSDRVG